LYENWLVESSCPAYTNGYFSFRFYLIIFHSFTQSSTFLISLKLSTYRQTGRQIDHAADMPPLNNNNNNDNNKKTKQKQNKTRRRKERKRKAKFHLVFFADFIVEGQAQKSLCTGNQRV